MTHSEFLPFGDRTGWRQGVWLTLGLWGFTYLTFLMPSFADHGSMAWYGYPIIAAAVLPGLLLSAPLWLAIDRTRGWHAAPRIALAATLAALAAGVHSMLDASIVMILRGVFAPDSVAPVTLERLVDKFLSYVWIYELYATALGLILSAATAHRREGQLAEARLAAHQAEIAALRLQINPHFLFNTLNAISGLIVTGRPAAADDMLGRLSDFLRIGLAAGAPDEVALSDELAALTAYLDIEAVRFGPRLRVEADCPAILDEARVPPFLLQPLVENAVKYAVGPSCRGATVRLEAAREEEDILRLTVVDDGDGSPSDFPHGTGLGLANIRNRLKMLYGAAASLEAGRTAGGFAATIRMPLRLGDAAVLPPL